ncbi:MAG: 23S rRNA (adenine(2503)-C(2))-methyltransferase RlmN [Elusimicrobiota bacterium]
MEKKIDIKGLCLKEMGEKLTREGYQSFRARQIFHWLYKQKVSSFQEMANLPKKLLNWLNFAFTIEQMKCIKVQKSQDDSEKYLFQLNDGQLIESVLIRNKKRNTICISSQVGCLWNCLFCASGKGGFKRNLSTGEIIEQILSVQRLTKEIIHNLVFMGMGEPFNNYDNVMKSIQIINSKQGINIGARKITVSTCGIIPGIVKLTKYPMQIELSVSLHSADEKTRSVLMPVNNKYPLKELVNACRNYAKKKNRQVTFEYLMLRGINDSIEQANKLIHLIVDFDAKVNLIVYNPIDNQTNLLPSDEQTIYIFQRILKENHIPVTIRHSKGQDINAACGQLRNGYIAHT